MTDFVVKLAKAIERNDTPAKIVKYFRANIDAVDKNGQTACHAAVANRRADILQLFLQARPNLALRNSKGLDPLGLSFTMEDNHEISLLLVKAGAPLTGDHVARHLARFAVSSLSAILALRNRGVVVSRLRDDRQYTPLHLIAQRRKPDWATLHELVNESDIDWAATNILNQTCISLAAGLDAVDALRAFINAGAPIDRIKVDPSLHHVEPLYPAVQYGNYKCVTMLLFAGASGVDYASHLALYEHASNRILPLLLAAGANLDAKDRSGFTLRHLMAKRGLAFNARRLDAARRDIAKARLDFVRYRALDICIGLQSLRLDALQLCEILEHACVAFAPVAAFHHWWKFATTVKHFKSKAAK